MIKKSDLPRFIDGPLTIPHSFNCQFPFQDMVPKITFDGNYAQVIPPHQATPEDITYLVLPQNIYDGTSG